MTIIITTTVASNSSTSSCCSDDKNGNRKEKSALLSMVYKTSMRRRRGETAPLNTPAIRTKCHRRRATIFLGWVGRGGVTGFVVPSSSSSSSLSVQSPLNSRRCLSCNIPVYIAYKTNERRRLTVDRGCAVVQGQPRYCSRNGSRESLQTITSRRTDDSYPSVHTHI